MILLHPLRLVNTLHRLPLHIRSLPLESNIRNLRRHPILIGIVHIIAPPAPLRHGVIVAKIQRDFAHVLKSSGGSKGIVDGAARVLVGPLMGGGGEVDGLHGL